MKIRQFVQKLSGETCAWAKGQDINTVKCKIIQVLN